MAEFDPVRAAGMQNKIVEFVRKKDFQLLKELGRGGFGRAVLLYDSAINENFVCKKYAPFHEEHKEEFYKNFVQEIKFLYTVNHPNIVRVFNYYLYPELHTGYILMEYVKGQDIEEHIKKYPENINQLFVQTIEGFAYLERNNVLHRDVRPQNIMVGENAAVKIIDFGFGKRAFKTKDFDKSISLNWQFELPDEFKNKIYDFQTELYFIGRLFERLVRENQIEHFDYKTVLNSMCQINPLIRAKSFADIKSKIHSNEFKGIDFSEDERQVYREFAAAISSIVSKIETGTKYYDEIDKIELKLEALHQSVMLEYILPDNVALTRCFIVGTYSYFKNATIEVSCLENFIKLLRSSTKEKKNIILRNIHSRLDAVERHTPSLSDEVPF